MYQWQKDIARLDIPADAVMHLETSIADVQVALPGFSAQESAAYLLVYAKEERYHGVIALHLTTDDRVVYFLEEGGVLQKDVPKSIEAGHNFLESMGFLLSNSDILKLDLPDRDALWQSLPVRLGSSGGLREDDAPLIEEFEEGEEIVEIEEVEEVEETLEIEFEQEILTPSESGASQASGAEKISEPALPARDEPVLSLKVSEHRVDASHLSDEERRRRFLENLGRLLGSM